MSKLVLVRGARQLLTLRGPTGPRRGQELGNLGIINGGAILIVDGLVREVGPSRRIENLAESRKAEEINAHGRLVMPGFVDSHTHLVCTPGQVVDGGKPGFGPSPESYNNQRTQAALDQALSTLTTASLETQARRVIENCVRHGTTTLEAKSGCGVEEANQLKVLRVHKAVAKGLITIVSTMEAGRHLPAQYGKNVAAYLAHLRNELLPLVRRRKLADIFDVFCDKGALTSSEARQMLEAGRACGLQLKMHVGYSGDSRDVATGVELGALSVDHLVTATMENARQLASSSTIATLLPGTPFYLGTERYAPARMLIGEGAAVALATNFSPANSPTHNMGVIISLACRKMGMTPEEAITAATINGAHALGRGSSIGSLEYGKSADLLILGLQDYRDLPYHFGVNLVEATMKQGRMLHQQSALQWNAS